MANDRGLLPIWIAICLALCAPIVNAQDKQVTQLDETELTALLDEIELTLGDLKSLRTEFVQEKHLSIFRNPVEAAGVLYFAEPRSIRFEIIKPYHSILIANEKSVAQFEKIDGKWDKLRTGGAQAIRMVTQQIANWLQGHLRQEEDSYTISAGIGTQTVLHLTPTDKEFSKYVSRIDITLNGDHSDITQLEIHEPNNDFTRIRFRATERNTALPRGLFKTSSRKPLVLQETEAVRNVTLNP